ncbi:ribosome silencing factor [Salinicola acroporae]|uniref:Ribosomal silencing factor RsfS n=1 Tax=Salinicola acroporae TaxID=1541440 RepID=A0ABT6I5S0_9GAMM|nr:ribosome silencing factor [Salinicola acroporae]MDH4572981.1 ribosome silencing factor [Salinicola acroporae]
MQTDTLKSLVVDALEELKARDVVELDVAELTSVTDVMVVASGTSSRHVSALADNVIEKAKEAGLRPLGVEGQQSGEWVLVDLGDVIAHVMMPETRQLYDLERLWADLPADSRRATGDADRQELRG